MGITQYRLAQDIGVPAMRISKILRGERGISADTALRLARYFGMSVEFWTGIQTHYEIEKAKMALADRLEQEGRLAKATLERERSRAQADWVGTRRTDE